MSTCTKSPESPSKSHTRRSPSSYPTPNLLQNTINSVQKLEYLDIESTYEDSFHHHTYYKTWDADQELCKVTEYNESLEYSVSNEDSDLAGKMTELNMKIINSITEKFPKISVASMCFSESSNINACDTNKKSYLEYIENLEIVNYSEHEMTEIGSQTDPLDKVKGPDDFAEMEKIDENTKNEKLSQFCGCNICKVF